jgi:hypothetical protein
VRGTTGCMEYRFPQKTLGVKPHAGLPLLVKESAQLRFF